MEKIKTPLQVAINKLQDRIEKLKELESDGVLLPSEFVHKQNEINSVQLMLANLIPAEREMIEKAYIQGCHDSQNFDMDLSDDDSLKEYASDEFTQTFQSYE